jgi:digeranylgeranylglycerophospholipid reductase
LLNVRDLIRDGARVIGITGTRGGQTVAYASRIVIGADGATSSLARTLAGPGKPDEQWAVALRGYVTTDVELDGTIELAFLDHLQVGYAWFFPSGKRCANVGVGMRMDFYKRQARSLRELLADYLAMPANAQRIGRHPVTQLQSWPLPLFRFEKPRVFDGALLAGDAGGFVHPITAAGIYPAIVTGRLAAEASLQALEKGDFSAAGLACYDALWQDALAADFKPGVTAGKLATLFPQVICAVLGLSPSTAESSQGAQASPPSAFGKF